MAPPKRKTKGAASSVALVSVHELCRLLAGQDQPPLTEMRISQLVAEGMPKAARGQYDPLVCMHWYLGKLRPAVHRKSSEASDGSLRDLTAQRTRLTAAQADQAEMERDEKAGRLIPIEVHETMMTGWALTVKQLALAVPARLSSKLDMQPRTKVRMILEDAMKGLLIDVATGKSHPRDGDSGESAPRRKSRKG